MTMDLLKNIRIRPEHFYAVLVPFALIGAFVLATGYDVETGLDYLIEFLVLAVGAVFASEFAYKFSPVIESKTLRLSRYAEEPVREP